MAYDSIRDVMSDVEEIVGQFNTVTSVVSGGISAIDSPTALSVAAGMEGVRIDVRTFLREFDTTQVEALPVVDDAAALLQLWRWRGDTRHAVMSLVGQARGLSELAAELVTGSKAKVIVSVQGDTLQRIAARELGDWREWPRLLEANPGVRPGALPSGTSLVIPDKRAN